MYLDDRAVVQRMTGATAYEMGLVEGTEVVHAVKATVAGQVALCGAGRIIIRKPGRFNPDSPDACPHCATAEKNDSATDK